MCEYDVEFGSPDCEDCVFFNRCKEYDDFSQQEDYLMELARERDEPWD